MYLAPKPNSGFPPQMRLSILLTYLLGKSPLFMQALRLVRNAAALATEALRPLGASVMATGSALLWALQPVIALAVAVSTGLQQLLAAALWGPLQALALLRDALVPLVMPLTSVASTLRWGGGVAQGVAGAAPAVARQHGNFLLLSSWARLEALQLQQALVLRAVRSVQAIVRFWVTAATTLNQHRVSLLLQLRQQLQHVHRRAAGTRVGGAAIALAAPLLDVRQRRRQPAAESLLMAGAPSSAAGSISAAEEVATTSAGVLGVAASCDAPGFDAASDVEGSSVAEASCGVADSASHASFGGHDAAAPAASHTSSTADGAGSTGAGAAGGDDDGDDGASSKSIVSPPSQRPAPSSPGLALHRRKQQLRVMPRPWRSEEQLLPPPPPLQQQQPRKEQPGEQPGASAASAAGSVSSASSTPTSPHRADGQRRQQQLRRRWAVASKAKHGLTPSISRRTSEETQQSGGNAWDRATTGFRQMLRTVKSHD
jgi:hypothetical protein